MQELLSSPTRQQLDIPDRIRSSSDSLEGSEAFSSVYLKLSQLLELERREHMRSRQTASQTERRVAALEMELRSYRMALADATAKLHERDALLQQYAAARPSQA